MFRIECSKCGELVEATMRIFTPPFVCFKCVKSVEYYEAAEPFNTLLAGKTVSHVENRGGSLNIVTTDVLDHEPSVDATNELIADLRKQLADAKETITAKDNEVKLLQSDLCDMCEIDRANHSQTGYNISGLTRSLRFYKFQAEWFKKAARRRLASIIDLREEIDSLRGRGF